MSLFKFPNPSNCSRLRTASRHLLNLHHKDIASLHQDTPSTSRRNLAKLLYATTAVLTIWLILRLPGGQPLTTSRLISCAIRVLYVYMVAIYFDRAFKGITDVLLAVEGNRGYCCLNFAVLALAFRFILRFNREAERSGGRETELPGFEGGHSILARLGRHARNP